MSNKKRTSIPRCTGAPCDMCGEWHPFEELIETVDEMLCESCLSECNEEAELYDECDDLGDDEP